MRSSFFTFLRFFSSVSDHATDGADSNPPPDAKHRPDAGGPRSTRRTPRLGVVVVSSFTVLAAPAVDQCSTEPCEPLVFAGQPGTFTAGGDGTCAVSTSGDLRCWHNYSSMTTDVLGSVRAIAVSGVMSPLTVKCAVLTNGGVRCWGYNSSGQLGIGTINDIVYSPPATDVLTDATAVVLGHEHTCALLSGGRVRCSGTEYVRPTRYWDGGGAGLEPSLERRAHWGQRHHGGRSSYVCAALVRCRSLLGIPQLR
jgi:hypothetical protein